MIARAAEIDVAAAKCTPNELVLTWQDSSYSVYSSLWLRDNDPAHRDAHTGQRLINLIDLPREPRLQAAELGPPGHITLRWEDGATGIFNLSWFRAFDRGLRIGCRPTRMPWMGQPASDFAWCDYAEWMKNAASREDWLYYAGRDGLAFLRNVPVQQGAVLQVAALLGFVGGNGRNFDIRTEAEPNNLAHINRSGALHTDQPYRDPVPGFVLLHCLSAAGQGGESIFVDGMAAAEHVRAKDPEAFSKLCQTAVLYRFQDEAVDFTAERTMLELDTQEQFRAIHYDDRSIAPLPLKGPQLKKYYPACRLLADLLSEPERSVFYGLLPGDLVLFDNSRILHGWAVFSTGADGQDGSRHLQGCHVDADGLYSSLAVLARTKELEP